MDLDQIVAEAHGPSAQAVAPAPSPSPRQIILEHERAMDLWAEEFADVEVESPEDRAARDEWLDTNPQ